MVGNIMIIDDSPVDRKIIRHVLEKRLQDVTLLEAEDGIDIADKLSRNNIHVCILDIIMPVKNGFEILEEIKKDPGLIDIPVIVCTGIDEKQAIEKALTLGAYDYFSKPLSEEAMKISLPLKVKNAIELTKRKEEIIYLSYHDKLTGLYNRRFCEEEMKRLDMVRNLPISIIVGDVNGLKLTNDAFGHDAGDKLLIKIANIIRNECRKDEIVARTGGDEFLIVLPKTNIEDAGIIAARIRDRCYAEKEDPIKPSISMGCSAKEHLSQDLLAVIKTAEDRMYKAKLIESKSTRCTIIATLRKTLHERFHEMEEHSERLIGLSHKLGKALGLSADQIDNLKLLAMLHDIGITAIPDHILSKNGDLTPEEENIIKIHSEMGYRIANASPDLAHISGDILSHHESWDGKGYPQGLAGEAIPINARIISVLDVYDSMVYGSFYQKPMPKNEAVEMIKRMSDSQFDPKIVEVFIDINRY